MVLGDSGSGNPNLGRRRGGKVDRNIGKGDKREEEREEEERVRGGAVFLAMQVLRIPAGGRGFPLVQVIRNSHNSQLEPG